MSDLSSCPAAVLHEFKLDENFGSRTAPVFLAAGHDVETVLDEGLSGSRDEDIFAVCIREQRCLVTLDLDFANVIRYPPRETEGIVVLRLPRAGSVDVMERLIRQMLALLKSEPISRSLWIVEVDRVRIHEKADE